ncbi:uncharacterized protein LOC135818063 [Sycon ciliatum]|uniref:uncharacterized protein LOC135818063 n=1 Tax=Sycon ciliatum TaxID=27933 RepID=UPI0031F6CEDE
MAALRTRLLMLLVEVLVIGSDHLLAVNGQGDGWINLLTFNAGLSGTANITAFAEQRKPKLLESIAAPNGPWSNADIVCLQEVFNPQDRLDVVKKARDAGFTYNYSTGLLETESELAGMACSAQRDRSHLAVLSRCLKKNCPDALDVTAAIPCLFGECSEPVTGLRQTCIECLGDVRGSGIDDTATACTLSSPAMDYASNLGLMLLSKKPLEHSSLTAFSDAPTPFRRGYIRSDVEGVGTVFCAHNFPNFETLPHLYPAFAARNLKQLQTLIDVASGHNSIVMGDMNSGPEVADSDVQATFVQSYNYATSRGFVSPYVDQANAAPDCTFCETNPINEAIFMGLPINKTILDHIFINPQVFEVNADQTKRVFTENVITIDGDTSIPLSDHYGVQVSIRAAAPAMLAATSLLPWLAMAAGLTLPQI